jgi:DNA-binding response OmpR family regulator
MRICSKVMIVEDDRALLELLREYFDQQGVEVVAVDKAAKAIEHLERGAPYPDVVLLDLRMPDVSGEQFLERLRAHPAWSAIPVALMSGDPARLSLAASGLPSIAKPFTIEELDAVLARHCDVVGPHAPQQ